MTQKLDSKYCYLAIYMHQGEEPICQQIYLEMLLDSPEQRVKTKLGQWTQLHLPSLSASFYRRWESWALSQIHRDNQRLKKV